jgi:hypothetical protein
MFTADVGDGKVHACAAAAALTLCFSSRCCCQIADMDDVWGDIRDDDEGGEAGPESAREAAIAAAVDRYSFAACLHLLLNLILLQRCVSRARQRGTGQSRRQKA